MGFSSDVVGGPLVIEGAQVKIFTKQSGVRGVITLDDGQVRQYSSTGMYH